MLRNYKFKYRLNIKIIKKLSHKCISNKYQLRIYNINIKLRKNEKVAMVFRTNTILRSVFLLFYYCKVVGEQKKNR